MDPPTTESRNENRPVKRAAVVALVISLALCAFSLNEGAFYALLNVSVILTMVFFVARAR